MEEVVSVIIPVYNCERFIEKCLKSVLNQSYPNLEIIIVNDGSNDRSGMIIDDIMAAESHAKIIHQDNKGVSVARNIGLAYTTGKYIVFLDGDDYLGKEYIKQLVETAKKENSELVICGYQRVDEEGNVLDRIIPGTYSVNEHEEWACRISAICSRLYKKEAWDNYGIRFEQGVRGEDVPISLFFNAVCKNIKTVQEAEYYYVQHGDSATHNFRGLHNFKLPYRTVEYVLDRLSDIKETNSREFLELGFMRFFTQCVFDLGRGAGKEQLQELCRFVENTMREYFPGYWKNRKSALFSDLDIPFINKLQVKFFMLLLKIHLLYPVARIFGRM